MNDKYLIIYHEEDNDGLFSCAISKCYLINEKHIDESNIDLYGTTYSKLSELYIKGLDTFLNKYNNIIMCDISFNEHEAMKYLHNKFPNNFVWNDHHLAAIKQSIKYKYDNINGIRDTSRSALLQTYKYFYDIFDEDYNTIPNKKLYLFKVLSAFDNFNWEKYSYNKEQVLLINKAINFLFNLNINLIYDLVYEIIYKNKEIDDDKLLYYGNILFKYDKIQYNNIIKNYGDLEWHVLDGDTKRSACAIFYSNVSSTIMFESLLGKIDNGIVFKRNKNNTWTLSLYNIDKNDTFNCGVFLNKKYKKGGGHIGAAGCTLSDTQFKKMLKNKTI